MEQGLHAVTPSQSRLVALAALHGGRALFVLQGAARWRSEGGYTFVPLELPGGPALDDMSDEESLTRIVLTSLGVQSRLVATEWTYAPSVRHAVDRSTVTREQVAPLALTSRMIPVHDAREPGLRPLTARIYRGELLGTPCSTTHAAALWLTPAALRGIVRGLPLAEVLGRSDVRGEPLGGEQPPEDALVYLASEYGERYLLRAAAKYGVRAVFGTDSRDA